MIDEHKIFINGIHVFIYIYNNYDVNGKTDCRYINVESHRGAQLPQVLYQWIHDLHQKHRPNRHHHEAKHEGPAQGLERITQQRRLNNALLTCGSTLGTSRKVKLDA